MPSVDKNFNRGFGCIARELIAGIVPGSLTARDILPQTVADLCTAAILTARPVSVLKSGGVGLTLVNRLQTACHKLRPIDGSEFPR